MHPTDDLRRAVVALYAAPPHHRTPSVEDAGGDPSADGPSGPVLETPVRAGDSKVDLIVDRLLTAIGIGEYLPGARLPAERTLATSLEVSRGTVRDAIAVLADQGVLQRRRGRDGGSFVLPAGTARAEGVAHRALVQRWDQLVELVEAGSRLHEAIARAAAERRTCADAAELTRRFDAFRDAETGAPRQQADQQLHAAIAEAAHLPPLTEALAMVERQISTGSSAHVWGAMESHRAMEARALIEHERLVALIGAGDIDAAGQLARRHAHIDLDLLAQIRDKHDERAGSAPGGQGSETP